MMSRFSKEFIDWLDENADHLDKESGVLANQLLQKIAAEGVFQIGVPTIYGGIGGTKEDVIEALTELGSHSLTAAFVSWGHRTFIENILASDNSYPRDTWLPELLTAKRAGGTGLSNAVKFLSNIEELNVTLVEENGKQYLQGRLPWVTNLRSDKFVAVFAAGFEDSNKRPIILAVPSEAAGLSRSEDLEFVSLQGSNTAALTFDKVPLNSNWILSNDAPDFIAKTRPGFLGYQFGLAFGLAQRSLDEVKASLNSNRSVLTKEFEETAQAILQLKKSLYLGLQDDYFIEHPKELFQLRIDIVELVATSLLLELQSSGGRGYFKHSPSSFIRRWNEGVFLPIVTPSAVQLRHILSRS